MRRVEFDGVEDAARGRRMARERGQAGKWAALAGHFEIIRCRRA
jgi:hypothetical protein